MDWTSIAAVTKTSTAANKLPICLSRMTVNQLQWFIVCLLKGLLGTGNIPWGIPGCRPSWWPDDVPWDVRADTRDDFYKQKIPWKDALSSVVRKCLKHYGKEELLTKCPSSLSHCCLPQQPKIHPNTSDNGNKNVSSSITRDLPEPKTGRGQENVSPFKKILGNKVDLGFSFVDNYITENASNAEHTEVFVCPSCEAEYFTIILLQNHTTVCINRLIAITSDGSPKKLDQKAFLNGLSLGPSKTADASGRTSSSATNWNVSRKIIHMCQLSKSSLSRIDFSSPLGRKFVTETRLEFHENLCPYERYCTTTQQRLYRSVTVWSKYPVTYKPKYRESLCHRYKFNRAEKEEFKLVLKTGLNRRGRKLLTRCKNMSIGVQRLSKREINYWLSKRDPASLSKPIETYIALPGNGISSCSIMQNPNLNSEDDLCIIKVIQHGEDIIVDVLGDRSKQIVGNNVFGNNSKNHLHYSRPQPPPLLGGITWHPPAQQITSPFYDHSYMNSLLIDNALSPKTGQVIDCKVVLEDIMHKVVVEGGIAKVKDTRFELYNKEGLSAGERCSFEPHRPSSKIAFSSCNDWHHKRSINGDVFHTKLSPKTNHSVDERNDRYLHGNPMLIGKENCAHRYKSYDYTHSETSPLKRNYRLNSINRINGTEQKRPSLSNSSDSSILPDRLKPQPKIDGYNLDSVSPFESPKRPTTYYNTRGPAKRPRLDSTSTSSSVRFKCHVCNLDEFLGYCPQTLMDYHMSSHGPLEFFYVEYVQQIGSATIPVVEACLKEVLPSMVENASENKKDELKSNNNSEIADNYQYPNAMSDNFECMAPEFPSVQGTMLSAFINGDREEQNEVILVEELIIVD